MFCLWSICIYIFPYWLQHSSWWLSSLDFKLFRFVLVYEINNCLFRKLRPVGLVPINFVYFSSYKYTLRIINTRMAFLIQHHESHMDISLLEMDTQLQVCAIRRFAKFPRYYSMDYLSLACFDKYLILYDKDEGNIFE